MSASHGSSSSPVTHHGYFCACSTDTSLAHSKGLLTSPGGSLYWHPSIESSSAHLDQNPWRHHEIQGRRWQRVMEHHENRSSQSELPPSQLHEQWSVSYPKGPCFKCSSSTHPAAAVCEQSHQTETFSLSPMSTWLSLTRWAWS